MIVKEIGDLTLNDIKEYCEKTPKCESCELNKELAICCNEEFQIRYISYNILEKSIPMK